MRYRRGLLVRAVPVFGLGLGSAGGFALLPDFGLGWAVFTAGFTAALRLAFPRTVAGTVVSSAARSDAIRALARFDFMTQAMSLSVERIHFSR